MKRTSGFTVIELASAIALLLVVVGLVILQTNNIEASNRDQQRKTSVNAIYHGLKEGYVVQNGSYPVEIQPKMLPYVDPASFKQIGDDETYSLHYRGIDCEGTACKGFEITNQLEKEATYKKTVN